MRFLIAAVLLVSGTALWAQHGPGGPPPGGGPPGGGGPWEHDGGRGGPPSGMQGRGLGVPPGKWWMDSELVDKVGLNADQQKRIEDVFQQSRLKLIDLTAVVQHEEAVLDPLLEAEHPDEAKVVAQIDRVASARGNLEKANARMLLAIRGVLTQDQWKKLQAERGGERQHDRGRFRHDD